MPVVFGAVDEPVASCMTVHFYSLWFYIAVGLQVWYSEEEFIFICTMYIYNIYSGIVERNLCLHVYTINNTGFVLTGKSALFLPSNFQIGTDFSKAVGSKESGPHLEICNANTDDKIYRYIYTKFFQSFFSDSPVHSYLVLCTVIFHRPIS